MRSERIYKFFYKWGWDTRCRNTDVARVLSPLIKTDTSILDVGCGQYGLSSFVGSANVVGVDVIETGERGDQNSFVRGSILALPFAERSFSITASVDVLEHLPQALRADVIKQLAAVATKAIAISFPSGVKARQVDEAFYQELVSLRSPVPEWLTEHLANPYPEVSDVLSEIEQEAARTGRTVRTSVFHSEALMLARLIRWTAVRSRYLYLVCNLLTGLLMPVLPSARKETAYRSIILAEFENA